MGKKIYDIIPPKEETKKVEKKNEDSGVLPVKIIKEPVFETKAVFASMPLPPEKIQKPEKATAQKDKKHLGWRAWLGICAGILVLIACVHFYFSLQNVEIIIWPKTEVLSFSGKVTADKSVEKIDLEKGSLPAKIFESVQDLWQDFEATGVAKNEGNASGTIKIYNKLSPASPFILKSGTHFLSDSGKYFVTSKMVTIPAASTKSGKLVPGSINVTVIAKEAGKDSNIGASKFSIPKLAGTEYYYSIYAESSSAMSGGYSGQVKQVTDKDLSGAKEILTKKVSDMAAEDIKNKVPSEYVLFNSAVSVNVTEAFSPVKSGAIVDNFNYQVKVKATALAFLRSDIEKFAKDKISTNLLSKTILEKSFKVDFVPESVDLNSGKMVLKSDFSARIYQPIDTGGLVPLVKEKNGSEISDIIDSRFKDQVEKKEINFWPFWTAFAPSDAGKIKVNLKFE